MASFPTPQQYTFNDFKGIRTRNGVVANGVISATVCKNIDFVPSSYDASINIATTKGNYTVGTYLTGNDLFAYTYEDKTIYTKDTEITSETVLYDEHGNVNTDTNWAVDVNVIKYDGHTATADYAKNIYEYTIIKGFEFEVENDKILVVYAENGSNGILLKQTSEGFELIESDYYYFDSDDNQWKSETIDPDNWLDCTTKANGITMIDNAHNTFVFTNGVNYYAWCPDAESPELVLRLLEPKYDIDGDGTLEDMTGLALCEYYGSLVIGGDNGIVLASSRTDITNYDTTGGLDTSAWAEPFGKPVTAVVPYIDSILVFTADDSTVLSGYQTIATREREDASLGGCFSFESWCNHDKYLFFYDDRQKNIYYYMQNNFGQKVLGEPLAPEVQKHFNNLGKLQMVSYVGNNRSEIWLLSDSFKLIYDYYVNEWTERDCQPLTSYFVYDNNVYSTSGAKVLREKAGNICTFDEVYYPAEYTTQIINLGSFSNAKEMDIYPLLSVTQDYNNSFYFDCLVDGKKEKSKHVEMYFQGAIWADSTPQTDATPDDELWDLQTFPSENSTHIQQVKGKIIPFWYYLQFSFKTKVRGEDFSISCFELKGITQEYDTIGRK